ncbi:class I SAM-dependent methyltransferase [Pseudoduganella aquatica]|uniref:class I SAM-dependent methyltransferase n=1 Tax=Pseudoduganella aquatica TaxID=2660641 RepID=UPI001E6349D2|nr:cyclopropane-fatty-acyl-phospholipid synthase family protein [Pseudoduganella aquatica]
MTMQLPISESSGAHTAAACCAVRAPGAPASTRPASARLLLAALSRIRHGAVLLQTPDGAATLYGEGAPITFRLANWNACRAVLRSGDIGFAESFIAGDWSTDNLPGLVELLARNREELESLVYGSWWGVLLYRLRHLLNRNSRSGSKKNIHAHYDLGNAFYQRWLDPSMTYSSALFAYPGMTLEQAQQAKYRRILAQLQVKPGERVLEIGCGWGGLAEMAARGGLHVTGLTLSREQLAYAQARLAAAGLAAQADLRLCDYRDSDGEYDAVASIEMFEAVGQEYWASYFACVARNLKRGGRACVQTITIADELFERYSRGTDFIQQYIFPGGMLPSQAEFRRHAAMHGLRVEDALHFGPDYAETLRQWRVAFLREQDNIVPLGFDLNFMRTWEFYLAYCEGAFNAGNTDVVQFTLVKD